MPNRITQLVLMLIMLALVFITIKAGGKSKGEPFGGMRNIEAMRHIDEAVGRAAEMGSHVMHFPGGANLLGRNAAQMMAGISVMGKVAESCALHDVPMKTFPRYADVAAVSQSVVMQAYEKVGKLSSFDPDWVMWFSDDFTVYNNAAIEYIYKQKPAAVFLVGWYGGTAVAFGEPGANIGALQIGGPNEFFALCCDYFMIGEEIFAAGAWASGDTETMSTIAAQDISKMVFIIIIIIGLLLTSMNNNLIQNLLSW